MKKIKWLLYVKWPSGYYSPCSFTKNGALYITYYVIVKRGIRGKDKGEVREVLIVGMPKTKWEAYLTKEKAMIIGRELPPSDNEFLILKDGVNK